MRLKEPDSQKASATWYIVIELALLFIALPILYLLNLIPFHKIIPLIFLFAYCTIILFRNKEISPNSFAFGANWKSILFRFLLVGALMLLFVRFLSPYPLFADLTQNKKLAYMLLMYPILSAFPQEVIFRKFFFYRYRDLFSNKAALVCMNVILFSFAHIYFASWIVTAFTLVGGLIFSLTFFKTRSLLVVTIEHTLYGLLILSSGLSSYFYKAF